MEIAKAGAQNSPAGAVPSAGISRRGMPLRKMLDRRLAARYGSGLAILVVVCVVGELVSSQFLTLNNIFGNVLDQASVLVLVTVGEVLIIIGNEFDLSLQSTVGFAPMVGAVLMLPSSAGGFGVNVNVYLAILIVLLVGAGVGLINGALIVKVGLNSFITTLAGLILLEGATLGLSRGETMSPLPGAFIAVGAAQWGVVPAAVPVVAAIVIAVGIFMKYTVAGRMLYAVGGNRDAATAAGVRVNRVVWTTFVAGGVLAAFAGIVLSGITASVTAAQGNNLIFEVFAASVIGGVSLTGGRGTVVGAALGGVLLAAITDILTMSSISSFWTDCADGAFILLALLISRYTGQGARMSV